MKRLIKVIRLALWCFTNGYSLDIRFVDIPKAKQESFLKCFPDEEKSTVKILLGFRQDV